MKNNSFSVEKVIRLALAVFICTGLIFIIVALVTYLNYKKFEENGIKTTAVITRIDVITEPTDNSSYRYRVYVDYVVDGQEYKDIRLKSHTSSMRVGKQIVIYYMPDDPTNIDYIEQKILFPIIFGSIGCGIIIAGTSVLLSRVIKERMFINLKKKGGVMQLRIEEVSENTNIEVNGRHPMQVICCDSFGNIFKSKNIYHNDDLLTVGDNITIYFSRYNHKRYFVDVDEYIEQKLQSFSED